MLWVQSTTISQPSACLHSFTAGVSPFASSFLWTLADSKQTIRPCSQKHDAGHVYMACHVHKPGCQATTLSSPPLLHLLYDCCYIIVILSSVNLYFIHGWTLWTIFHEDYITRIPLCWSTPPSIHPAIDSCYRCTAFLILRPLKYGMPTASLKYTVLLEWYTAIWATFTVINVNQVKCLVRASEISGRNAYLWQLH